MAGYRMVPKHQAKKEFMALLDKKLDYVLPGIELEPKMIMLMGQAAFELASHTVSGMNEIYKKHTQS